MIALERGVQDGVAPVAFISPNVSIEWFKKVISPINRQLIAF